MKLRSVEEILPETRVVLRLDTDLPMEGNQILDNSRLVKSVPTLKFLLEKQCRVAIIGHRGRPEGRDENLSLKPVYLELMSLLEGGQNLYESVFVEDVEDKTKIDVGLGENNMVFLENLRFWPGEAANDAGFLQGLMEVTQFYVNDALAAHQGHASIMMHQKMPAFYGLSFIEEVEKMERIVESPARPLTIILGGAKEDKLKYLEELERVADYILIGGKLPLLMKGQEEKISEKVRVAKLREDGLDLSEEDITQFKEIIGKAKTIIWAGAVGYYEDAKSQKGSEEIAGAVAESQAYKVVAGGDTGAAVKKLGLEEKIDYVCSGGGVMLEYLAKGSLPAFG